METKVFSRVEKKYLITATEKKRLLKTIRKHMEEDGFFHSDVLNLYLDTKNLDLIVQSIDQPVFKEKVRARSYGGYDRVFLEIKSRMRKKDDENAGYKRRIMITHDEFNDFLNYKTTLEELMFYDNRPKEDIQIAKEVDYIVKRMDLRPQILVLYHRESYKGENRLRITFDEKLRYRNKKLGLFEEECDKMYFKNKRNIIMEVKAHGSLPLWLVELLSKNHLYSQRFSKVGKIHEKIRKEENV